LWSQTDGTTENNEYATGEWPRDFIKAAIIALKNQKLQSSAAIAKLASSQIQQR
jgi:hypothetical protein